MERERKTRPTTVVSLHLPEEIIEEILMRVPVKSLLRLRCVSKSWLSLIDGNRFIKTHLQYSTKNKNSGHHRVIIFTSASRGRIQSNQCSLRALLEDPKGTDLSPLPHLISPGRINDACCCNGLVCVYKRGRFVLQNPSTRVSKELPEAPGLENRDIDLSSSLAAIGLGWDESSGAYKVFAGWHHAFTHVYPRNWYHIGRVYNSKTNSWKMVEYPNIFGEGKFVRGKLHWLSESRETIIFFDVETEVFGTIELPGETKALSMLCGDLGVTGGCLCLTYNYGYVFPKQICDVWVMKEHGVRESWEKLPAIQTDQPDIIGEIANGEILIDTGSGLLFYCPKNGVIRHCRHIDSYFEPHLCVESLVSPVGEISSLDI